MTENTSLTKPGNNDSSGYWSSLPFPELPDKVYDDKICPNCDCPWNEHGFNGCENQCECDWTG